MDVITKKTNSIQEIANGLRAQKTAVFPFDTIWGLTALATDDGAQKLMALKQRPQNSPFIVLVKDMDAVKKIAQIDSKISQFATQVWPGPTTLILFKHPSISDLLTGGKNTIAVRIPSAPWVMELLEHVNAPILSTSANISGEPFPTHRHDISSAILKHVDMVYTKDHLMTDTPSQLWDLTQSTPTRLR